MIQDIKARSPWKETISILIIAITIAGLAGGGIALRDRHSTKKNLLPWEVDAFKTFDDREMSIYEELSTMTEDIDLMHQINGIWPEQKELEDEGILFYQPYTWSIKKHKTAEGHGIAYRKNEKNESFILLLEHDHEKDTGKEHDIREEIWIGKLKSRIPDRPTYEQLASYGWRKAVGTTGAKERERITGGRS